MTSTTMPDSMMYQNQTHFLCFKYTRFILDTDALYFLQINLCQHTQVTKFDKLFFRTFNFCSMGIKTVDELILVDDCTKQSMSLGWTLWIEVQAIVNIECQNLTKFVLLLGMDRQSNSTNTVGNDILFGMTGKIARWNH